ncbi:MAG TPA: toprim domain-containing protein [Rubrivivax sp.]|nr:toprim domain-containing protein [Rubrivivax sp.]
MRKPFHALLTKFEDCQLHGPGSAAELLVVEGDSAMASVLAVRNNSTQAVLALQGKPMNAWVSPATRVQQHAPFQALARALGLATPTPSAAPTAQAWRHERLVLLLDPDADGIHIGALLVLYVQRWLPQLIAEGRLWLVRAPMFEVVCPTTGEVHHADNPTQCQALAARLTGQAGGQKPQIQTHRGLGSIAPPVLRSRCVDPATRQAHAVAANEVAAVVEIFGRGLPAGGRR